jgi:hypothetical protein
MSSLEHFPNEEEVLENRLEDLSWIAKHVEELTDAQLHTVEVFLAPKVIPMLQADRTISGPDFLRLSKIASSGGVSDEVLKYFLETNNISIKTSEAPFEDPGTVVVHTVE